MPKANKINTLFCFTVRGRGEFPFDMLRYDTCWLEHEVDTHLIAPHHRSELSRETRELRMIGLKPPTLDRWSSFGWKVGEDVRVRLIG